MFTIVINLKYIMFSTTFCLVSHEIARKDRAKEEKKAKTMKKKIPTQKPDVCRKQTDKWAHMRRMEKKSKTREKEESFFDKDGVSISPKKEVVKDERKKGRKKEDRKRKNKSVRLRKMVEGDKSEL